MKNITGAPVEGNNFFGREKELEFAWKHIEQGNSLVLSAPRRVGKSSFAKKILSIAKEKKWNTIELNLEEIKSEESFVKLFIESIQHESWWQRFKEKSGNVIQQLLESIQPALEMEGMKATFEWKTKKTDIYEKLKQLLDPNENTIIMIDELTVLLNSFLKKESENGKEDVEFFLNWLRSFRQKTNTKIRWIFCSSISIDNFTNKHALSYTINDVENFPIGAFSDEQAKAFITELASSQKLKITEDQNNYIRNKMGWNLPYFIQIIINKIHYLVDVESKQLDEKTIDEAYALLIKGKDLNTWDERLKEYVDMETYARFILKRLSKIEENRNTLFNALNAQIIDIEKADNTLSKLLYMLQNDGYIMENEGQYGFRSPFLKDFWFNRFVR